MPLVFGRVFIDLRWRAITFSTEGTVLDNKIIHLTANYNTGSKWIVFNI